MADKFRGKYRLIGMFFETSNYWQIFRENRLTNFKTVIFLREKWLTDKFCKKIGFQIKFQILLQNRLNKLFDRKTVDWLIFRGNRLIDKFSETIDWLTNFCIKKIYWPIKLREKLLTNFSIKSTDWCIHWNFWIT